MDFPLLVDGNKRAFHGLLDRSTSVNVKEVQVKGSRSRQHFPADLRGTSSCFVLQLRMGRGGYCTKLPLQHNPRSEPRRANRDPNVNERTRGVEILSQDRAIVGIVNAGLKFFVKQLKVLKTKLVFYYTCRIGAMNRKSVHGARDQKERAAAY